MLMRCDHCSDLIPKGRAVSFTQQDQTLMFCCSGCLAVYQFLQDNPQERALFIGKKQLGIEEQGAEQAERTAFSRLVLVLILFAQLGLILLLQLFSDFFQLSATTQTVLQWAFYPYLFIILAVVSPTIFSQLRPFSAYTAAYSILLLAGLVLFAPMLIYFDVTGLSKELVQAVLAILILAMLLFRYYELKLHRYLLALQPLQLVKTIDVRVNQLSIFLLLAFMGLFLYFLPQTSFAFACYIALLAWLIFNPSAFKLLTPSALYCAYQALLKHDVTVRSAGALEQLARVNVVLLNQELKDLLLSKPILRTFFKQYAIELQVLDVSSSNASELQLRLLQQQGKVVLLCVEEVLSQELLWKADVTLSLHQNKQLLADISMESFWDLATALGVARRYLRSIWVNGLAILFAQLFLNSLFILFGNLSLLTALLVLLLSTSTVPLLSGFGQKNSRTLYE